MDTQKQQYYCKQCKKYVVISYSYHAYQTSLNYKIVALTKEGVGIRGISRLLSISQNTVLSRIKAIASQIKEPILVKGKEYEVDELRTFIQTKSRLIWVVSALRKDTGEIVRCNIGSRTNKTLKRVTESLELSEAKNIYTDGLKQYKTLIGSNVHKIKRFGTNHIERYHLNLRTHLKD
ncbi:IS1 family transposase [Marinifilum sp.]|uniref:IS1 family transposase n=1 Tax=Marinifilum sp. TaxID=2033137 RepID=UPI003BAD9005